MLKVYKKAKLVEIYRKEAFVGQIVLSNWTVEIIMMNTMDNFKLSFTKKCDN